MHEDGTAFRRRGVRAAPGPRGSVAAGAAPGPRTGAGAGAAGAAALAKVGPKGAGPLARPDRLYSFTCSDQYITTKLTMLGVPVNVPDSLSGSSTLQEVEVKWDSDMQQTKDTVAVYAALHWLRLNGSSTVGPSALSNLLPKHPEFKMKGGRPYLNTPALLWVPALQTKIVHDMATWASSVEANVVVSYGTRAIAFGIMVAYELGLPFVPLRSAKDLTGARVVTSASMDMVMDGYNFLGSDRVIVVDDVISTGRTVKAIKDLVEAQGCSVVGCVSLVDIGTNASEPRERIPGHFALIKI